MSVIGSLLKNVRFVVFDRFFKLSLKVTVSVAFYIFNAAKSRHCTIFMWENLLKKMYIVESAVMSGRQRHHKSLAVLAVIRRRIRNLLPLRPKSGCYAHFSVDNKVSKYNLTMLNLQSHMEVCVKWFDTTTHHICFFGFFPVQRYTPYRRRRLHQ